MTYMGRWKAGDVCRIEGRTGRGRYEVTGSAVIERLTYLYVVTEDGKRWRRDTGAEIGPTPWYRQNLVPVDRSPSSHKEGE